LTAREATRKAYNSISVFPLSLSFHALVDLLEKAAPEHDIHSRKLEPTFSCVNWYVWAVLEAAFNVQTKIAAVFQKRRIYELLRVCKNF
jgi:hypothetical protein